MKTIKFILKAFLFIFLFSSCSDKSSDSIASLTYDGDLIGFVTAYNVIGTRLADNSGIIVTAVRSNYPDTTVLKSSTYTDTTNVDGRFLFERLSTGTYNLTFKKAGYGVRKIYGYQFLGGGQAFFGSTYISEIPSFTVTSLTASPSIGSITVSGAFSGIAPSSAYKVVRLFIGTSPTVSSLPQNYILSLSSSYIYSATTFGLSISSSTLATYGISTGQTIYVTAYTDSNNYYTSYLDLATGRTVFSSLNPAKSNTVSVLVQ